MSLGTLNSFIWSLPPSNRIDSVALLRKIVHELPPRTDRFENGDLISVRNSEYQDGCYALVDKVSPQREDCNSVLICYRHPNLASADYHVPISQATLLANELTVYEYDYFCENQEEILNCCALVHTAHHVLATVQISTKEIINKLSFETEYTLAKPGDLIRLESCSNNQHLNINQYYWIDPDFQFPDGSIGIRNCSGDISKENNVMMRIEGHNFTFDDYIFFLCNIDECLKLRDEPSIKPTKAKLDKLPGQDSAAFVTTTLDVVFRAGDLAMLTERYQPVTSSAWGPNTIVFIESTCSDSSRVMVRPLDKADHTRYSVPVKSLQLFGMNFTYELFTEAFYKDDWTPPTISLPEDRELAQQPEPTQPKLRMIGKLGDTQYNPYQSEYNLGYQPAFPVLPQLSRLEMQSIHEGYITRERIEQVEEDLKNQDTPKPDEDETIIVPPVGAIVELKKPLGMVLTKGCQGVVMHHQKTNVLVNFQHPAIPFEYRIHYSNTENKKNHGHWKVKSEIPGKYSICLKNLKWDGLTVTEPGLLDKLYLGPPVNESEPELKESSNQDRIGKTLMFGLGRVFYIHNRRRRPRHYRRILWKFYWQTNMAMIYERDERKAAAIKAANKELNPEFYSEHGNALHTGRQLLFGILDKHLARIYNQVDLEMGDKDRSELDGLIEVLIDEVAQEVFKIIEPNAVAAHLDETDRRVFQLAETLQDQNTKIASAIDHTNAVTGNHVKCIDHRLGEVDQLITKLMTNHEETSRKSSKLDRHIEIIYGKINTLNDVRFPHVSDQTLETIDTAQIANTEWQVKSNTDSLTILTNRSNRLETQLTELQETLTKYQSYYNWYEELNSIIRPMLHRLTALENPQATEGEILQNISLFLDGINRGMPHASEVFPNVQKESTNPYQAVIAVDKSDGSDTTAVIVGAHKDGKFYIYHMFEDPTSEEIESIQEQVYGWNQMRKAVPLEDPHWIPAIKFDTKPSQENA